MQRTRNRPIDTLQMEIKILGHECQRVKASMRIGDKKSQAEADVCQVEPEPQDSEGHRLKKVVEPDVRREMAGYAIETHETSERRACQLYNLSRNSFRYIHKKTDEFEIKGRLY